MPQRLVCLYFSTVISSHPSAITFSILLCTADVNSSSSISALSSKLPTFAMLGDIAALHDLSSFVVPTLEKKPNITFIVNDNNGGGIFNLLEQSEVEDFERVFGTPTDINLEEVFKSLGADVKLISKVDDLVNNLTTPNGVKVLVVKIK